MFIAQSFFPLINGVEYWGNAVGTDWPKFMANKSHPQKHSENNVRLPDFQKHSLTSAEKVYM